jgi:hypothetical protein
MECPICFTDVDRATTGEVHLVCGHTFHFRCLASWFISQIGDSTCPCCRNKASHYEDLPTNQEVGLSDSESEGSSASEEQEEQEQEAEEEHQEEPLAPSHRIPNQITVSWVLDRDGQLRGFRSFVAVTREEGPAIPLFPLDTVYVKGDCLAKKLENITASLGGLKRFQALWRGYLVRSALAS